LGLTSNQERSVHPIVPLRRPSPTVQLTAPRYWSVNANVDEAINLAPTGAGARSLHILDKSTFGQAGGVPASDDDVIKHSNVDECKCFFQTSRDELISLAGFSYTARMVVRHDNRRGIVLEGLLDDFTWVHRCAIDGAAE
jgi:hypothetical protein